MWKRQHWLMMRMPSSSCSTVFPLERGEQRLASIWICWIRCIVNAIYLRNQCRPLFGPMAFALFKNSWQPFQYHSTFWQQRDRHQHGWSYQNLNWIYMVAPSFFVLAKLIASVPSKTTVDHHLQFVVSCSFEHPGSSCMATVLCIPHPPPASAHQLSSSSCSSWTCVHDCKLLLCSIHSLLLDFFQ